MTKVTLQYCMVFGKNDSSDWCEWEIKLEGNEETAYLNALKEGTNPNDCDELIPILNKTQEEILEVEKDNLADADMLDEDGEIPDGWYMIVEFKCDEEDE